MNKQFVISSLCNQAPACRINLAACHAGLCCVKAHLLRLLHDAIYLLHLCGCRAESKCPCGISYVSCVPERKVDHYHVSLAKLSICYFGMRQRAVRSACNDEWIKRRLVRRRVCTHFHCLV